MMPMIYALLCFVCIASLALLRCPTDNISTLAQVMAWNQIGNKPLLEQMMTYLKTSNISRTLECNKIDDHSGVVGASPVGAAPTTSSYLT